MRIENQPKEDFSERDILYKVLFDMKRDMVELKKLVADIIEHGGVSVNQASHSQTLKQLYHDIELPGSTEQQFTLQQPVNNTIISSNGNSDTYNIAHDAEEVEESLSLIEKESDLIRKALKKHKGKRKLAANELGISERTLYRKIKELNL
jgi:DNA-binding NtrC family response regulator